MRRILIAVCLAVCGASMGDAQMARAIRLKAEMTRRSQETLARYTPLPKILPFHQAPHRVRCLFGGNRAGKTTAGAIELGWYATRTHPYRETPENAKILCVENTWSLIGDPMWAKLSHPGGVKLEGRRTAPILPSRLIAHISWQDKGKEWPEYVVLKTGATLAFKPCEAGRTKFEGSEYDFVWCDEEMSDNLVFQEIIRSLIDRGGALISTATPLARGRPLMALHEMADDPNSPLEVYEQFISITENPHLDEAATLAFMATIPEEYYETRVHGAFLILEGLVYKTWTRGFHELSPEWRMSIPHDWPRIIVIDPGYADPCAILWAVQIPGKTPRYVAYREYYKKGRSVSEVVEDIVKLTGNEPLVKAIIDPAAVKKAQNAQETVYDQFARYFRERGLLNARTKRPLSLTFADNAIKAGIYNMMEFLKPGPDGLPGFQIIGDLFNFRKELNRYGWPPESDKRNSPEIPIDKDNHLLDCARYLLMSTPLGPSNQEISMSTSARIAAKAEKERREEVGDSITIGGGVI